MGSVLHIANRNLSGCTGLSAFAIRSNELDITGGIESGVMQLDEGFCMAGALEEEGEAFASEIIGVGGAEFRCQLLACFGILIMLADLGAAWCAFDFGEHATFRLVFYDQLGAFQITTLVLGMIVTIGFCILHAQIGEHLLSLTDFSITWTKL
jgi:hypothetical protein